MALPVRGLASFVLFVLGLCAVAQAQPRTPTSPRAPAVPAVTRPSAPDDALALSGPVDPQTYIVGPGDVFAVSIGGGLAAGQLTATVSADGLLVLPGTGTVRAAGRTLATVRSEALAALSRFYRNVPTDVALAAPRRFSVFVSGAVPQPGRQTVSSLGRIEDAVAEAAGGRSPLDLADYATPPDGERRVALRNVRIVSRDGRESRVDLVRYYATGSLDFNPTLTDGDAVFVPTFDPSREGVSVGGDVDRPGYYDWRPNDTAAALVAAAGGPGLDAAGATLRRTRVVNGQTESVEVPLANASRLDVQPRDLVSVRAAEPDAGFARAEGAVRYPGAYPIRTGQTTLRDLVEAAGGLTDDALVRGAILERPVQRTTRAQEEAELDSLDAPNLGRLSDLGLAGRRYYTEETTATPRLAFDLTDALTGATPVVLQDGDRLVVPQDLGVVRVSGQVAAPGYLPFEPGRTAGDYVAQAGGPGPVATTVYVVDARTGLFKAGPQTPVEPGDAVFVDRPPTFDSPEFQSLDFQSQSLALDTQGQALQERSIAVQEENLVLQRQQAERDAAAGRRQVIFQTVSLIVAAASTVATVYILSNQPQ